MAALFVPRCRGPFASYVPPIRFLLFATQSTRMYWPSLSRLVQKSLLRYPPDPLVVRQACLPAGKLTTSATAQPFDPAHPEPVEGRG